MKTVLACTLLVAYCCSGVARPQDSKPLVESLIKNNAHHQQMLLEASKKIEAYQTRLSERYQNDLEKVPDKNIPLKSVQDITAFANELPVVMILELNTSYILDLTQNVFTVCELAPLLRADRQSQIDYKAYLSKHLGFLTQELQNKSKWATTVVAYYQEVNNLEGLAVVQEAKRIFDEMNQFYINEDALLKNSSQSH